MTRILYGLQVITWFYHWSLKLLNISQDRSQCSGFRAVRSRYLRFSIIGPELLGFSMFVFKLLDFIIYTWSDLISVKAGRSEVVFTQWGRNDLFLVLSAGNDLDLVWSYVLHLVLLSDTEMTWFECEIRRKLICELAATTACCGSAYFQFNIQK